MLESIFNLLYFPPFYYYLDNLLREHIFSSQKGYITKFVIEGLNMVNVRLVDLSKHFGRVKAVDNLNLDIKDGEFVAFLGPSGCGKTTTLLMIAGIYRPTNGYIYFDDQVVNEVPPKDRNIGMVFQSYALYPHMKVYDNIAFPLKLKKRPKAEIDRKVREAAKLLNILELLDRKPSQLSGGQQQRVALARALVKEPQLFLMDEPLSNLDAKLRIQMRAELKRMQRDLGITTIYVTHDQIEAMTMADRIAVLNLGKLQQYATPVELYNRPANTFVAGFIGSLPMNLIDGDLVFGDGAAFLNLGELTIKFIGTQGSVLREVGAEGRAILGVRPEDIIVGEGEYEGDVFIIEPLGRDKIVHINAGGIILRALVPVGFDVDEGDKIRFTFVKKRIHLFDGKSGEAYF